MRDFQPYEGPREAAGIIDFALDWLEKHGAPPEVNQLLSAKQYEEACSGPIICLLAALPHLLDTGKAGREGYLSTLMDVAKKNRKGPFRLFWTEGGAQAAAEEALGLTFGYPAVAALSKVGESPTRPPFHSKGILLLLLLYPPTHPPTHPPTF